MKFLFLAHTQHMLQGKSMTARRKGCINSIADMQLKKRTEIM